MSDNSPSLNAVIVMQEDNWEDDGGAHDPVLVTLTAAELTRFRAAAEAASSIDSDEADALKAIVDKAPRPSLPCTIHDVLNIWHRY